MLKTLAVFALLLLLVISCKPKPPVFITRAPSQTSTTPNYVYEEIPGSPLEEFRGLWVASIANIDWPSRRGLSSENQQSEFRNLAETARSTGINALLVQVRAASDAFYAKGNEPWAEWLMGEQGLPPSPPYDPLEFMISETHGRGMEFHAWLNLNRGRHKNATSVIPGHLIYTKPEWFLKYDGYTLYNFGLPEVRDYIASVVVNIVRNYDVDGIHFDDYFYPYKVAGEELNDRDTFRKYSAGFKTIEDWRRNNIDLLIRQIAKEIKKEKSWVVFGISPFGVWRNKSDSPEGSATRGGQPSYDYMFADTRKWAREGWIDYITPQIYFPFEHKLVPYGVLTDWCAKNAGNTRLYIGHGIYRVDKNSDLDAWKYPNQIPRQIEYNRLSHRVDGSIFYSSNALYKNRLGLTDSLKQLFQFPALTPEIKSIATSHSSAATGLRITKNSSGYVLGWNSPQNSLNLVYFFEEGQNINLGDPANLLAITPQSSISWANESKGIFAIIIRERGKMKSKPAFLRTHP